MSKVVPSNDVVIEGTDGHLLQPTVVDLRHDRYVLSYVLLKNSYIPSIIQSNSVIRTHYFLSKKMCMVNLCSETVYTVKHKDRCRNGWDVQLRA